MKKRYKEGTTLNQIIEDGWSRGFKAKQTVSEAAAMGFGITKDELFAVWDYLERKMEHDLGCKRWWMLHRS